MTKENEIAIILKEFIKKASDPEEWSPFDNKHTVEAFYSKYAKRIVDACNSDVLAVFEKTHQKEAQK